MSFDEAQLDKEKLDSLSPTEKSIKPEAVQ